MVVISARNATGTDRLVTYFKKPTGIGDCQPSGDESPATGLLLENELLCGIIYPIFENVLLFFRENFVNIIIVISFAQVMIRLKCNDVLTSKSTIKKGNKYFFEEN